MKKETIIAIASLLAFGQGAWAQTTSFPRHGETGENSESNPYIISSVEDLNALASDVNSGTSYVGKYFKLTAEDGLDYSGKPFTPIGIYDDETPSNCNPFMGIFDGQGNTIYNITYEVEDAIGVGLFGYISGALIRNVVIDNCSFTGNSNVGAIAGLASGPHDGITHGIFNCIVGSNVTVTAASVTIESDDFAGTFAGGIIGDCANTTLSGCTSAALVKGDDYVGGIAGRLISSIKDGKERGVIEDCFFTRRVTETETINKGDIVGARGPVLDEEQGANTNGLLKLTLLNNDTEATVKNATRISNYDGETANVTLDSRTLYKDGNWNTLCLPFNVSTTTGPLSGDDVSAMTLDTTTSNLTGSTLTLNFTGTTSIAAGTPFIIKWNTGTNLTDGIEFTGVTIDKETSNASVGEHVTFTGAYTPVVIGAGGDNTKLYLGLGKNNQNQDVSTLYYPSAAMTIGAFRAYFQLNGGITASNPDNPYPGGQEARTFVLNFADDATGIGATLMSSEKVNSEAWHSLDGRKLNSKPTQKGLYIYKGKKMVVK